MAYGSDGTEDTLASRFQAAGKGKGGKPKAPKPAGKPGKPKKLPMGNTAKPAARKPKGK